MDLKYGIEMDTETCSMDMDVQHNMDMEHGNENASWTGCRV